jgi:hypothetical protein
MISECREAGLLHSSREQEIRNRAFEIYLQRGGNLAMSCASANFATSARLK